MGLIARARSQSTSALVGTVWTKYWDNRITSDGVEYFWNTEAKSFADTHRIITKREYMLTSLNGRSRPDTNWYRGKATCDATTKSFLNGPFVYGFETQRAGVPAAYDPAFFAVSRGPLLALRKGTKHYQSAISRLHPLKPQYSLPTIVGELKDLPRLDRSLKKMADLLRRLRAARSSGDVLSDTILGLLFGVAPSVGVLVEVLDLGEKLNKRWAKLMGGGFGNHYQNGDASKGGLTGVNLNWGAKQPMLELRKPPISKDEFLKRMLGLTRQNLIATGWELFPFSWAFDWISDMGNLIRNQSYGSEWEVTSVCFTYHLSTEHRVLSNQRTRIVTLETKARYCGLPVGIQFRPFFLPDFDLYKAAIGAGFLAKLGV
jgi:hypothetical protein